MDFEWDAPKAKSNLRKHGVSFEEAAAVFADPYALTDDDVEHSQQENRERTLGRTVRSRVVVVITTNRDGRIRVVSARKANSTEVQLYEEEVKRANRGER